MAAAKDEPPPAPPIPQRQRRRRVQSEEDLRLAVPTRVELWNLVLPDEIAVVDESSCASSSEVRDHASSNSGNDAPRKLWYTAQHEHSILAHVSLEIIVHESAETRSNDEMLLLSKESRTSSPQEEDDTLSKESKLDTSQNIVNESSKGAASAPSPSSNSEIILFQGRNDNGLSVNPQWFHLQEKLAQNPEWMNLHRDTYESLEFRFTARQQCFLQTPVHPSLLISLGTCSTLPSTDMLPVNTLVVFFSDQTLRILPLHYQLLVQYDAAKWATSSDYGPDANNNHNAILHPQSVGLRQSSLVRPLPDTKRLTSARTEDSEEGDEQSGPRVIDSPRFRDDVFRALDNVAQHHDSIRSSSSTVNSLGQKDGDATLQSNHVDNVNLPSRNEVIVQDLQRQQQRLRQAIAREKEAQKKAKAQLASLQREIRDDLIPQHRTLTEQTQNVQDATNAEQRENQKLQLLLEAHRIRLVRGLEACFPVELKRQSAETVASSSMVTSAFLGTANATHSNNSTLANGPTLRGWSLPSSAGQSNYLFSTAMSDEELSAVLGVFCHVVVLLGKYLGVPLRYRIFSNSSRSAVQDDRGIIYPLFLARPVEREQVEYALLLLERNVQCIARARGLSLENPRNGDANNANFPSSVLEQVHRIYKSMTHQATN